MKPSRLFPIICAIAAAIAIASLVTAQPIPPSGIPRVVTNSPGLLGGSGTTTNPLTVSISTGGIISGTGSSGSPITATEVGDISSVVAGTGLSGGATSGAATLNVNIAGASCASSEAITALSATGTGTCSTVGDITSVVAGTSLTGGATSGAATLNVALPGASCAASEAVTAISAAGTGTCSTVGDITSVVAGTNISGGATSGAATINVATTLDQSASGSKLIVGDFEATVITDTISAQQNDYAPTNHAKATIFEITPSGAARTITGLAGGVNGRIVYICNPKGTAQQLCLDGENSSSTLTNRFNLATGNNGVGVTCIRSAACAKLYYSASFSRWQELERTAVRDFIVDNTLTSNGTTSLVGTSTIGTANISTMNAAVSSFGGTASTVAADTDNWAPSSFNIGTVVSADPTGSDRTVTGMTGGFASRFAVIRNQSTTINLIIANQSGSSTSTNRFSFETSGADYTLRPGRAAMFWYYVSRWVYIGSVDGKGTTNKLAKWTNNSTLGDGGISDDGTTISWTEDLNVNSGKFTVTGTNGNTAVDGTLSVKGNTKDVGTLPTITSCGSGATRTGGARSGTVTVGTGATGCTISFASALSGTPSCNVTSQSHKLFDYTVSTTALTITNVDDTSSTLIDFSCEGH